MPSLLVLAERGHHPSDAAASHGDLFYADDVTSLLSAEGPEAVADNARVLWEILRGLGLRLNEAKTHSALLDRTRLPREVPQRMPHVRPQTTVARIGDRLR